MKPPHTETHNANEQSPERRLAAAPCWKVFMNITKDDLGKVITGIADSFDRELYEKTQAELEELWHFKWDENRSIESNIYEWHNCLADYGRFCRRWEHHHNGYICIVERVRDKYLMPKIKAFADIISNVRKAEDVLS